MKEKDSLKKRMREILFTTEHTLTPEQFNKRLEEKMKRARLYQIAYKKQGLLVEKYK